MVQKQTKISTPWTPPDFGDPHGLRNFVTFEPTRRWRLKVIGHCTVFCFKPAIREFFGWHFQLSWIASHVPLWFWGIRAAPKWFTCIISSKTVGVQSFGFGGALCLVFEDLLKDRFQWQKVEPKENEFRLLGGKWANRLIELLDGKWLIILSARTFDLLFETNLYTSQVICSSG